MQPEVESLLKTLASATGYEAQNAAAMQAVRAIIRAYSMSTKGLRTMQFKPVFRGGANATTEQAKDNERESVEAPAGRGLLGAQMRGIDHGAPGLPPLLPDDLAHKAELALAKFSEMPNTEQMKPKYQRELTAARDKLLERLEKEAPATA